MPGMALASFHRAVGREADDDILWQRGIVLEVERGIASIFTRARGSIIGDAISARLLRRIDIGLRAQHDDHADGLRSHARFSAARDSLRDS